MASSPSHDDSKFNTKFFLTVFLLILLVNFYMFQAMFHALAFAAITAGTFYPIYLKIEEKFRLKKEIAALIMTSIIILIIVIPVIFMCFQVSKEAVSLFNHLGETDSIKRFKEFAFGNGPLGNFIKESAQTLGFNIELELIYGQILAKLQTYGTRFLGTVNSMISDTLSFFFNFLIMILAIFSIFVDGHRLKGFIFKLSPLPEEQEELILDKFSQMNYVTLVCNGLGGVIQGILAGIGMWLCGLNNIFLWTTIMVLLAFIPLVGISIVTIPATIYLFAIGKTTSAITFFIYTGAMALIIENWFKPKFMGSRIKVNSLLLLFYIIGGMGTFGMAGIFYGPLLCITFLTMVELFQTHYLPKLD